MENRIEELRRLDGEVGNYSSLNFKTKDIPSLKVLIEEYLGEGDNVQAAEHAFMIIVAMKSKVGSKVLVALMHKYFKDDWMVDRFPSMMAPAGKAAIPALESYFCNTKNSDVARSLADEALQKIAQFDDSLREGIVNYYRDFLSQHHSDPDGNALVIGSLDRLNAVEAIEEIRSCFKENTVEKLWCGDLEDVEISLGLREERTTPQSDYREDDNADIFERMRAEPRDHLRDSSNLLDVVEWYFLEYGSQYSIWYATEFHGFMTAVVCAPDMIPPSQWMEAIWDRALPIWEDEDAFSHFFSMALEVNNEISRSLYSDRNYEVVVNIDDEGNWHAQDWSKGFVRGLELWDLDPNDRKGVIKNLSSLTFFSFSEDFNTDLDLPFRDLVGLEDSPQALLEAFKKAYKTIHDRMESDVQSIFDYFLMKNLGRSSRHSSGDPVKRETKVGRNERCPCGSGKKYKKCCLRNTN